MRHVIKSALIVMIAAFVLAAMPSPAHAYSNLTCNNGFPSGTLYDSAKACQGITGIKNIFSGLVCNFQYLLDEIMKRVYCGLKTLLEPTIKVALTVYVLVFGLQIMLGTTQSPVGEGVMRIVKLSLVYVFATNANFGVGIAFNFFISATNDGIAWVLGVAMPGPPGGISPFCQMPLPANPNMEQTAFFYIDTLICSAITGPFTVDGAKVAGFMGVLSYIFPPVFAMFVYFTVKAVFIFLRALMVYILGLTAIAFLITLGPIFLGFALFKYTFRFFDDWIRFMTSFTLQIVLIFAAVAMWIVIVGQLGAFFTNLASMLIQVPAGGFAPGGVIAPVDTWGVCEHNLVNTAFGPALVCDWTQPVILPSRLPDRGLFLYFVVVNLLGISTVAYVFDGLMKNIPALARQLAGPSYAPQIGGGNYRGAVKYAGILREGSEGNATRNIVQQVRGLVGGGNNPNP